MKAGDIVEVQHGMTSKPLGLGVVLSVSPTGKRITITWSQYATGRAVYYRTGERTYRESFGGVSYLNNYIKEV